MVKLKDAARKSGLFIVTDSDLDFNQPVVRVKIDRTKANDLGITMQSIGATLATLLGGNYINRFNLEGRSYQVIPQVPRGLRLSPESLGEILCADGGRTAGAAVDAGLDRDRDRSERAHALQPVERRHLPGGADARRDRRSGGGVPRRPGQEAAGRLQPRLPGGFPAICSGGQSAGDRLRLRAGHHLPGAGGAVRKPARPAGDHDQRADGDLGCADSAVLRRSPPSISTPRSGC